MPLFWSFLALESGVVSVYPGTGAVPESYDARSRPWYKNALNRRVPVWGRPFVDPLTSTLVLPCSEALYDDSGRLLGVLAVELTFDHIAELLRLPRSYPAVETYLLDDQGAILVAAGARKVEAGGKTRFPYAAARAAMREAEAGNMELRDERPPRLVAFARVGDLGYTYVAVAEAARVLGGHL
jgi:hypothetical protein